MSYEPEAHVAQAAILRHLLFVPGAAFAALQKQTNLSSDHFNFHIKKLIETGYIEKNEELYQLTRSGKEYANRMDTDDNTIEKQPKLSVAVIVENDRGEQLAQQRLKQPYFGYWGRLTGKVRWGETTLEAAARELMEEAGITADLEVRGLYHKMDFEKESGDMLEDKYFIVVFGKNPQGHLIEDFEGGKNAWMSDDDLLAQDTVFESIREITAMARGESNFYLEGRYEYAKKNY
jgi:ADP-ribose pyrophosphatase YjhB (NUDIX family)/predicted transcriptional regulator